MIIFTQGDDNINLTMYFTDSTGAKINLSGAAFETRFKGIGGRDVVIPNGQHTPDVDQVNNIGKCVINLLQANTQACEPGDTKDIVTKVVQSGVTLYYHGKGLAQVLPKSPQE